MFKLIIRVGSFKPKLKWLFKPITKAKTLQLNRVPPWLFLLCRCRLLPLGHEEEVPEVLLADGPRSDDGEPHLGDGFGEVKPTTLSYSI